jgi:group I intron endonuclease
MVQMEPELRLDMGWQGVAGIYVIQNRVNGKIYIGSSKNLRSRLIAHHNALVKGVHANSLLQNAWNKYGKEEFRVSVVEVVESTDDLLPREQFWIDIESPFQLRGYNILPTAGNNAGYSHTDATKAKISAARIGKIATESTLEKMREVQGNRSQEWKDGISRAKKGWVPIAAIEASAALRRGQPLSPAHSQAIKEAMDRRSDEEKTKTNAKRANSLRGQIRSPENC